jgi:CRISPR/Cas system type I-B associated protein Csh2 (Cas7 group RAMP superfamily)
MENESIDISIPAELFKQIEEKIKDTDVASVQDYVIKVIKGSLTEGGKEGEGLSKEEEDKVKERLKALGYMD